MQHTYRYSQGNSHGRNCRPPITTKQISHPNERFSAVTNFCNLKYSLQKRHRINKNFSLFTQLPLEISLSLILTKKKILQQPFLCAYRGGLSAVFPKICHELLPFYIKMIFCWKSSVEDVHHLFIKIIQQILYSSSMQ